MCSRRCPTSRKTSYDSYEQARTAALRMPVLWSPVAVYACDCGRWHLTSMRQQADPTRYSSG